MAKGSGIVHGARQCDGIAAIVTGSQVVTRRPKRSEIEQCLPLSVLFALLAGTVKRHLVALQRAVEVADGFEGEALETVDCEWRFGFELVGELDGLAAADDDRLRGKE